MPRESSRLSIKSKSTTVMSAVSSFLTLGFVVSQNLWAVGSQTAKMPQDPCLLVGEFADPSAAAVGLSEEGLRGHPASSGAAGRMSIMDFSASNLLRGLELSLDRRLKVVCEVKTAVLEKYAMVDMKKERLHIDVDQHLQDCAREELALPEDNDRQHFLDRVQKCIAGFQDTHFGGYARVQRPAVVTAIVATFLDGKIYIAKRSPLLIAKIKAGAPDDFKDLEETLAPGNEIVKIDGVEASQEVASFEPYINSSSPEFAHEMAAKLFFARTFLFPEKKTVKLEIRTLAAGDTRHVELPWMAQIGPGNFDAQVKFARIGFPTVNDLQWKYHPVLHKFDKNEDEIWSDGYSLSEPLFAGQTTFSTFNSDSGDPGLRTAEVILDRGHVFCYMQLLTFYTKQFTELGAKDGQDFLVPIEKFVANCEAKQLPLILDLKQNYGGNGSLPPLLLSVLAEKGKTYGGSVEAFRVTPSIVDLLTGELDPSQTAARNLDNGVDIQTLLGALSDAIGRNARVADIINDGDISVDPAVGGFSQKIVAIVSPFCISACDMAARLLKNSGRAILVGSAANGTGGGFESNDVKVDSTFMDGEGQLSFEIPNFMFGVERRAGDPDRLPFDKYESLLMENEPTVADVRYGLQPLDLVKKGAGLGNAAVSELFR